MGKYQKWCFPQKVYAMVIKIIFDKNKKSMYNKNIGNKHTECMLPIKLAKHYIAVPKQNVVFLFIPYSSTLCIQLSIRLHL